MLEGRLDLGQVVQPNPVGMGDVADLVGAEPRHLELLGTHPDHLRERREERLQLAGLGRPDPDPAARGAEDLRDSESSWEIICDPSTFQSVREALEAAGVEVFSAEISMVPQSTIPVDGGEAKQVLNLIEALEELDDVQNVYANFDIPEAVMASL